MFEYNINKALNSQIPEVLPTLVLSYLPVVIITLKNTAIIYFRRLGWRVSPPLIAKGLYGRLQEGKVRGELKDPVPDVETLSVSILQMRNGSGLDRSSPKHLLRCLIECRVENGQENLLAISKATLRVYKKFIKPKVLFVEWLRVPIRVNSRSWDLSLG